MTNAVAVGSGPLSRVSAFVYHLLAVELLLLLHHRSSDPASLRPAAAFVRGYRLNARGALAIWAVWLAVVAANLFHLSTGGWAVLVVVVLAVTTVWMLNAMVILALFTFRLRDVARLSAYLMVRKPWVTVADLCLILVAVFVSEIFLLLLGAVLVLTLLGNSRRLIEVVRAEFTG